MTEAVESGASLFRHPTPPTEGDAASGGSGMGNAMPCRILVSISHSLRVGALYQVSCRTVLIFWQGEQSRDLASVETA